VKIAGTIEEGGRRNKNTSLIDIVQLTHLSTPSPKENVVSDLVEIFSGERFKNLEIFFLILSL
jgi:hypothetical protein